MREIEVLAIFCEPALTDRVRKRYLTKSSSDSNYDGNVILTDFTFLASNFNQTVPVPLPSLAPATTTPFAQQRVDADLMTVVDDWAA